MPTNTSAKLCARCHSDSRFNWDNWKNSRHYRENMNCAECHDPHSAGLRHVAPEPTADESALCLTCHEADEHLSPYSTHGRAGVSCADCHLGKKSGVDTFHVVPNHSFKPDIAVCNDCHIATLHRPAMPSADLPAAIDPRPGPTAYASPIPAEDKSAPSPAQQPMEDQQWWLTLLAVAGLIGFVAGVAVPLAVATLKNKKSRRETL
jgi:predicted CXXCH cytochrome family protein